MAERPRGSRNLEVGSIQICGRGGPHNEAERGRRLIAAVAAIQADNVTGVGLKAARGQDRTIPHAELSPGEYLGSRLEDQRRWYEDKAALYSSRARVWRAVALALALGGAVISGIAAAVAGTTFLGAWVGVTGTLGGIVAAHVAGSRFSYLAQTYELTARRLDYLRTGWGLVSAEPSAAKWSDFVQECEATISAEREQWIKEWQRQIAAAGSDAPNPPPPPRGDPNSK